MKSILSVTILSGVLFSGIASAKDESVLNVYSSRHYDVDLVIHDMFTRETGIKIQHVQIKEAAQLIERVKAEGSSSSADVIMTVDVGNLHRADQADILASVKIPAADQQISAELRHPDGKWFAVSQRARVLVYNTARLKPEQIQTYEDLANPALKGKVLVRSSNHVYNQSLIASLIYHLGPEKAENWVQQLSGNLARKPEGGDTDQIRAVALGVGDVAIANSYYLARLAKSEKPVDRDVISKVGVVFPNQKDRGTHVNVSGVAIARHAPHKEAAHKFIAFLLSPKVQAMYAEENGEYPVIKDVPLPPFLSRFGQFKADTTSLAAIGQKTPIAVKLTDKSAWR